MKKTIVRVLLGIFASVAVMASLFYFFMFANPVQIHQVNLLKWIPIFICAVAMYASGKINKDTPLAWLILLFLPFAIFDLFNFFYFPFVVVLFAVGILALITTRNNISTRYRRGAAYAIAGVFIYFLATQPLIIEHEGFGRSPDGTLVNATVLWDFTDKQPPALPSHVMMDQNGNDFDIKKLKGKTHFIAFWATWCGPCLEEKPQLDKLKKEYQEDPDVTFIDISIVEDPQKWRAFLNEHDPAGMQLISQDVNQTRRRLNIGALPLHFLVDSDGTYVAYNSLNQAEDALRRSEK